MQNNLFCVSAPLSDNSLESVLEPLDGLVTLDLVGRSNMGLAAATLGNTLTRSGPTNLSIAVQDPPDYLCTHMQQKKSIP